MIAEPWQIGEIPGPKKAIVIKSSKIVAEMIKRARRPLLIVGHEVINRSLGERCLIEVIIELAKKAGISIIATGHTLLEFKKRGFQPSSWASLMDIVSRLQDPTWKGFDGKGQYDLVMFIGYTYYLEWTMLSSLKHFSSNLKTISLDGFYQPHATFSFDNLSQDEWEKQINNLLEEFK